MAITLTTDPIMTVDDVRALAEEDNITRATVLVNSVSAQFRTFTNRIRITDSGSTTALVEYLEGLGSQYLWLHSTPIISVAQVDLLAAGNVSRTLAAAEYEIYADAGSLYRNYDLWPEPGGERDIKVTYRAGWVAGSLPGDVVSGAIQQMRWERTRMDGKVGAESVSRGGESVSLETGQLLKSVREAWSPWRIMA
jgi:hypothetical protein